MTLTPEEHTSLTSVAEQLAVEMSEEQLLREIGLRARTFAMYPCGRLRREIGSGSGGAGAGLGRSGRVRRLDLQAPASAAAFRAVLRLPKRRQPDRP